MNTIALQKHEQSWVVKIRNTSEAVVRSQHSLGHHTNHGPTGLGQYDSLGEYCGSHILPLRAAVSGMAKGSCDLSTAPVVFLIFTTQLHIHAIIMI